MPSVVCDLLVVVRYGFLQGVQWHLASQSQLLHTVTLMHSASFAGYMGIGWNEAMTALQVPDQVVKHHTRAQGFWEFRNLIGHINAASSLVNKALGVRIDHHASGDQAV